MKKKIEFEVENFDYHDAQLVLHEMLWLESKGWKRKLLGYTDGERMDIFSNSDKYSLIFYYKDGYEFEYYCEVQDNRGYFQEKKIISKYFSLDEAFERQESEDENEKR